MSEQKYLKLFMRNWWKYWLAALISGLIVGYLVSARMMPKYEGIVLFTLTNKPALNQKDTPFYLYDGYYNQQAAVSERANLSNWLQSAKTVYDIYTQAQVTPPAQSAQSLHDLFEISEVAGTFGANSVNLVTTSGTEQNAQSLSQAVIDYTKSHYTSDVVTVSPSSPLVIEVPPAKKIVLLAITVAITFGVFLLTLMVHYFQKD